MAAEKKSDGRIRLRCDAGSCEALFVPRAPLIDQADVRLRAQLYGWRSHVVGDETASSVFDFCPEHTRSRGAVDG